MILGLRTVSRLCKIVLYPSANRGDQQRLIPPNKKTLSMQNEPILARSGPVEESARITSIDLIRGIAILGILLMNAVSFKFGHVPVWNISAGGSETWLDWTVAVFGEIFVDQKFMGLFSLLFGAGMMLFIDRVSTRERHPVWLSLWRNALLLSIGILHFQLWDGDVLMVYAIASVLLIGLRKLPARVLIALETGPKSPGWGEGFRQ